MIVVVVELLLVLLLFLVVLLDPRACHDFDLTLRYGAAS
jgi:hypothetical protein